MIDDLDPADKIILSLICEYKFDTYEKILLDISTLHQFNSTDFIMDCLYMRYLKLLKKHGPMSKILNFSRQMTDKKIVSQYHIAFAFYFNDDYQRKFKEQIIEQLKYNINDEPIKINGIQISDTILYYLNKHMNQFDFTKKYKNINEAKIKSIYNELYSSISNYDRNNITNEIKNVKHYYSVEFWQTAVDFNLVDHLSFNVKKNPFLLHAGACLMYVNRLSKINFRIEHFEYPKKVTNEIINFIFEKYDIDELLEYKTLSIELKNLLSLICLLQIKEVNSFESLLKMQIHPKSLIILTMIYRNYNSSVFTRKFAEFVVNNIYTNYSNDFLLLKILFTIMPTLKPKKFDSILPDFYWPLYPNVGEPDDFYIHDSGQYNFLLYMKNKKKKKIDQLIINKGFIRKELKVQNELVEYQIGKQDLTFLNYNK